MQKLLDGLKLMLLLAALAVFGSFAFPGMAEATFEAQVTCEGEGHTCHAKIGGTVYHLKAIPDTF